MLKLPRQDRIRNNRDLKGPVKIEKEQNGDKGGSGMLGEERERKRKRQMTEGKKKWWGTRRQSRMSCDQV